MSIVTSSHLSGFVRPGTIIEAVREEEFLSGPVSRGLQLLLGLQARIVREKNGTNKIRWPTFVFMYVVGKKNQKLYNCISNHTLRATSFTWYMVK